MNRDGVEGLLDVKLRSQLRQRYLTEICKSRSEESLYASLICKLVPFTLATSFGCASQLKPKPKNGTVLNNGAQQRRLDEERSKEEKKV